MDIKSVRDRGREAFKNNYWPCVLAAFLLSLVSSGGTAAAAGSTSTTSTEEIQAQIDSLTQEQLMAVVSIFLGILAMAMIISFLLRIFLVNPLDVGCSRFFKKNIEENPAPLGVIKEGFSNYCHTFATLFLRDLFITLWAILFIIPGIIKGYSYRLVPYILRDNPELSATETITRSKELMDGHKMDAFKLDLSFLGWLILGVLTLGIGLVFWTSPYMESAEAQFYVDVLNERG